MKFRNVILVALVLLVAGFVVPATLIADRVLEDRARAELAEELAHGSRVLEELQRYRGATLASQVHVTSEEPRLKAVVASEEIEHATVYDVAVELGRAMGSDIFLMFDPAGKLIADVADAKARDFDLSSMPVVAQALANGRSEGVVVMGEKVFQVGARTMKFGDTVVGGLVVGYAIDDRVAQSIGQQTGATIIVSIDGRPIVGAAADGAPLADLEGAIAHVALDGEPVEVVAGGERWVAVARPLPGYSGRRTVGYTLLRSLDDALAANRELARRLGTVACITLAAAMLLGLLLARTLARPLDRLVAFTREIAAGRVDARARVEGPVEVRALAKAMNAMATDIDASRGELHRINAALEQTVDERTRNLRIANAEVAEMLDNLEDAVLIVNAELRIEPRCSSACRELFGIGELGGRDIREVLFHADRLAIDHEALAMHSFVFEQTFGESEFQWSLNAHLLLREVRFRRAGDECERTFELKYAPLYDDAGCIARVMIVVGDLTELLALRRGMETEQRRAGVRVDALLALGRCSRREALQFVDDNEHRMTRIADAVAMWARDGERAAIAIALRELHTIKGNARALRLGDVSKRVHVAEDVVHSVLAQTPDAAAIERVHAEIDAVRDLLATYGEVADEVLRHRDGSVGVGLARVQAMLAAIARVPGGPSVGALATMADLLRAEAGDQVYGVTRLLEQQRPMIDDVSKLLGKQVTVVSPAGQELYLSVGAASAVRDALVHSLRNALDHGIEAPHERVTVGKPETGELALSWQDVGDEVHLRLIDDGRGIDPERIVAIARTRGLIGADEHVEDVTELLFTAGFSSKEAVTEISGRGVGLEAVRAALTSVGLAVRLTSVRGRGTTLEIRIPRYHVHYVERDGVAHACEPLVGAEAA